MVSNLFDELRDDASLAAGQAMAELISEYMALARAGRGPVSTPLSPEQLAARFDEPLPRPGQPLAQVIEQLRLAVVADANRLFHPMYLGHQVSPPLPAAIWVESLIGALNNSLAVNEMSPTATAVERQVVRWMCQLAGFGADAGGTFCSGGTEATFTGLLAARARSLPDAWQNGVGGNPPRVIYGENTHYAVARALGELGLGLQAGVIIPDAEPGGPMDPGALAAAIERLTRGGVPIMAVVATAGSTPTGSFDDLRAIGELCRAHRIWLHVDAAHGGSALFSDRHRPRLAGLELADTVAWDPHKMMLMPSAAGVLLARDERLLDAAFAQRAPYLFHGGEGERIVDQGVRSFQCTRRADAIKVWTAIQRYGASGIGTCYDDLCQAAEALWRMLLQRPKFEPCHQPGCNILCFRWTGTTGGLDSDAFNQALRERYNRSGRGWITSTVLGGRRVLRVTIMNPLTREGELAALLDGLTAEAEALLATPPGSI